MGDSLMPVEVERHFDAENNTIEEIDSDTSSNYTVAEIDKYCTEIKEKEMELIELAKSRSEAEQKCHEKVNSIANRKRKLDEEKRETEDEIREKRRKLKEKRRKIEEEERKLEEGVKQKEM